MISTDFLARLVLDGVAFETGMALSTAVGVMERGYPSGGAWGNVPPAAQYMPMSVAAFISLAMVYEMQASELIKKIEIANIQLRESLKEYHPEFNDYIDNQLALGALNEHKSVNPHPKHSLQNLLTCDEYVKAGIDRLLKYYKNQMSNRNASVTHPQRDVDLNAPSTEGECRITKG